MAQVYQPPHTPYHRQPAGPARVYVPPAPPRRWRARRTRLQTRASVALGVVLATAMSLSAGALVLALRAGWL